MHDSAGHLRRWRGASDGIQEVCSWFPTRELSIEVWHEPEATCHGHASGLAECPSFRANHAGKRTEAPWDQESKKLSPKMQIKGAPIQPLHLRLLGACTDQPKSAILSSPRIPKSRFSGLMSRWMTCLE